MAIFCELLHNVYNDICAYKCILYIYNINNRLYSYYLLPMLRVIIKYNFLSFHIDWFFILRKIKCVLIVIKLLKEMIYNTIIILFTLKLLRLSITPFSYIDISFIIKIASSCYTSLFIYCICL